MDTLLQLLLDVWHLVGEMAPYLLLGFLLAGLMHEFIPARMYSRYLSASNLRSVLTATLVGIPLPLCSCGVIPTAMGLRRQGASPGATTAFLIATPQTGVDSIIATYSLLGLPFALLRPFVALVTAVFGGVLVNTNTPPQPSPAGEGEGKSPLPLESCKNVSTTSCQSSCKTDNPSPSPAGEGWGGVVSALHYAFVEMAEDIGKWLMVGLLVAGLITAAVPDEWFALFRDNSLLSILLVLCISVPMYVCATGSIPIAVALMTKGLTPGAALVLLMAGPACNTASVFVVRKVMGNRTLVLYLAAIVSGAVLFGLGIDWLLPREWFTSSLVAKHACCAGESLGWFSQLCAVALLIIMGHAFLHPHHTLTPTLSLKGEGALESQSESHIDSSVSVSSSNTDNNTPSPFRERAGVRMHISGMNCNHCATSVQQALSSVPGVTNATVSLHDKQAVVEGTADISALRQAVESLGFEVID